MKRFLITAALILAAAGSASAMTSAQDLSGPEKAAVRALVPGADVSNLTTAQVGAIGLILSGDDSGRGAQIRSVLGWN
ncbi:MAG TPA: hypothetical protein VGA75_06775 [Paracoccaceae bacterium]